MRLNFILMAVMLFASLIAPAALTVTATVPMDAPDISHVQVKDEKSLYDAPDLSDRVRVVEKPEYTTPDVGHLEVPVEEDEPGKGDYSIPEGIIDRIKVDLSEDDDVGVIEPPTVDVEIPHFPTGPLAICSVPLEITPNETFYYPAGGKVKFTSNLPNTQWFANEGTIEVISATEAIYTAPKELGGSKLQDTVTAQNGFCWDDYIFTVRAGTPATLGMSYPTKVVANSEKLLFVDVKDKYGNPAEGATVSFTLTSDAVNADTVLYADGKEGAHVYSKANADGRVYAYIRAGSARVEYNITARYGLITNTKSFEVVKSLSGSTGGSGSHSSSQESVYVVGVEPAQDGTSSESEVADETSVADELQVVASAQDSSASSVSLTYPKVAYVGDTIEFRVTSGSQPVPGREVTITSPDGDSVTRKTSASGYIDIVAEMEGKYTISVDGTEKPVTIEVKAKPVAPVEEKEPSFDIVGAITGGNQTALSAIAVVVLLVVLVIGAAVYFLNQKEPEDSS